MSVSVVIPTYNCAAFIRRAIESALAQTYKDLEVIVADDGSTDDTASVVSSFGSRVKYLPGENRGPAFARNRGIQHSSGELVAFLDSDDWWEPKKLELQVPHFRRDKSVAIVYSDMAVHYEDGHVLPSFLKSRPQATSGDVFDRLLDSQFIFPSTTLIRRACLEEAGNFDESLRSLEDCDLYLRVCYRWKVALVPQVLVHRRQRSGNLTSNEALTAQYGVELYDRASRLPGLSPARRRRIRTKLSNAYLRKSRLAFKQGAILESRRSASESLRLNWQNFAAIKCMLATFLPNGLLALRASRRVSA